MPNGGIRLPRTLLLSFAANCTERVRDGSSQTPSTKFDRSFESSPSLCLLCYGVLFSLSATTSCFALSLSVSLFRWKSCSVSYAVKKGEISRGISQSVRESETTELVFPPNPRCCLLLLLFVNFFPRGCRQDSFPMVHPKIVQCLGNGASLKTMLVCSRLSMFGSWK